MLVTVVGKQYRRSVDNATGKVKEYVRCFGTYKFGNRDNVDQNKAEGEQVVDFYASISDYDVINVGDRLMLDFNKQGYLIGYDFV